VSRRCQLQLEPAAHLQTTFSDGDGVETFAYRVESGKTLLLGYNINSMALITK